MNQYNNFKVQFDKDFESIYTFIGNEDNIPYQGRLMQNADNEAYDSYGYEDSSLRRIYYFGDYDIYVEFTGTRQSYNGEEWSGMKQVFLKTKTIEVYE
jgi:hypothetical protein